MVDTFTLDQNLAWAEYIRLNFYILSKHKLVRRIFIYISCIAIFGAIITIFAHSENEVVTPFSLIAYALMPPLFIALFFSIPILLFCLYVFKFQSQRIRGIRFEFTHWGVERIAQGSEITVPWRGIGRLVETKLFFFLYQSGKDITHAFAISKSDFKDLKEQQVFKTFIESKIFY